MGWCLSPTRCMWDCQPFCPGRHPHLLYITWNLHPSSVDVPVDVHGRSCSFPFIHPREVILACCWVITRPLSSCGIGLLSLPPGVGLTGVGLVHPSCTWQTPTCKEMPASDAMKKSWLQCGTCDLPCWSFTWYEGMSVTIWCTTSWGLSSHLTMIFLFHWKASALTSTSKDYREDKIWHFGKFPCSGRHMLLLVDMLIIALIHVGIIYLLSFWNHFSCIWTVFGMGV